METNASPSPLRLNQNTAKSQIPLIRKNLVCWCKYVNRWHPTELPGTKREPQQIGQCRNSTRGKKKTTTTVIHDALTAGRLTRRDDGASSGYTGLYRSTRALALDRRLIRFFRISHSQKQPAFSVKWRLSSRSCPRI